MSAGNAAAAPPVALVTGASGAIGGAVAVALAERGWSLALSGRRSSPLEDVSRRCTNAGAAAVTVHPSDLAVDGAGEALVGAAWESHGGLAAVVTTAGAPRRRHASRLTVADVTAAWRANTVTAVSVVLAVLPRMLGHRAGTIVVVGSLSGRLGPPREAAYAASKFALTGFAESLAVDLWDSPVAVRLVQPGPIDTPMWGEVADNEPPVYTGPRFPPAVVAAAVVAAVEAGPGAAFETFVPAEFAGVVELRARDPELYLAGAAAVGRGEEPGHLPDAGAPHLPDAGAPHLPDAGAPHPPGAAPPPPEADDGR